MIWAEGLVPDRLPQNLDEEIALAQSRRQTELTTEEDAVRAASRDMLRLGRYKPTGRGKPASEYLLRAAAGDGLPRIWPAVDICNLISLRHLVPASVWDLDRAGRSFLARRGRAGESYVFNASGQEIGLEDLLLVSRMPEDIPIVNPVKDCHETKTTGDSRNVAAVVYFPAEADLDQGAICGEFESFLRDCGAERTGHLIQSGRP